MHDDDDDDDMSVMSEGDGISVTSVGSDLSLRDDDKKMAVLQELRELQAEGQIDRSIRLPRQRKCSTPSTSDIDL